VSVVFCPLCGKELHFPMTVDSGGEIVSDSSRSMERCDCVIDFDIWGLLESIALTRMITMMRTVVEVSEAR
jgi:predicted nucleic acid binding AN1-type Zn finger protein